MAAFSSIAVLLGMDCHNTLRLLLLFIGYLNFFRYFPIFWGVFLSFYTRCIMISLDMVFAMQTIFCLQIPAFLLGIPVPVWSSSDDTAFLSFFLCLLWLNGGCFFLGRDHVSHVCSAAKWSVNLHSFLFCLFSSAFHSLCFLACSFCSFQGQFNFFIHSLFIVLQACCAVLATFPMLLHWFNRFVFRSIGSFTNDLWLWHRSVPPWVVDLFLKYVWFDLVL